MRKKYLLSPLVFVTILLFGSLSFAQNEPDRLADVIKEGNISIRLTTVAEGLTAPNWGTPAPGDKAHLFVTDQNGILWAIELATGAKRVFLDARDRLVSLGVRGPGSFDERGLLGVAFHPRYARNGLLYTYTSEPVTGPADFSTVPLGESADHQAVILEWKVNDPADPESVVDPASSRVLLRIDEPQFNHDGGAVNFGPDGKLYISLGDGGGRDDQGVGHSEGGNGQDPSNVLGSILRIDPNGTNSANAQYGIPDYNPFVGQPGFVDEIFAYGFRNPFRFSFDMARGDLYVGDVGQDDIEEVDVVTAGGNYGWNLKEGSFCFDANGTDPGFAFVQDPCPNEPPDLIDPVAEYNTADSLTNNVDGRSVIGGFVYRGNAIKELFGRYVFGDFSRFTDTRVNNDGRLFFLKRRNIVRRNRVRTSKIREFELVGRESFGRSLLGFGQDASGELYVMANDTGVPFGTGPNLDQPTGVVLKISAGPRGGNLKFAANLSGDQEVPPVDTNTTGDIDLQFNRKLTKAEFALKVNNGVAITQAHLHCAAEGENGPVVAFLSGSIPGGFDVDGELAEFTLTDANIAAVDADCLPSIGMSINDIADLAAAAQEGKVYVNVHSVANPPGEVRGQLN